MNTSTKIAGFAVVVVTVFGGAAGIGAVVGPIDVATGDSAAEHDMGGGAAGESGEMGGMDMSSDPSAAAAELPGGLLVSQDGYTLDLVDSRLEPGGDQPLRFRIVGPEGEPVTEYTEEHGKDLHLIVVRRDLTGYRHVHPTLDGDGVWTVPLELPEAGEYRVFADFAPAGGEPLTLGADLSVPGAYEPRPQPDPVRSVEVDGYTVTLDGRLAAGEQSKLTLSVSKNGEPVTDLQPYLEAYGHLVALRDGDLAYLHVHPDGSPGDGRTKPGPDITFYAETPTAGNYRLFLDFRHQGEVRTAAFSVTAGTTDTSASGTGDHGGEESDGDHAHGD